LTNGEMVQKYFMPTWDDVQSFLMG
jgi:hypothetical protein